MPNSLRERRGGREAGDREVHVSSIRTAGIPRRRGRARVILVFSGNAWGLAGSAVGALRSTLGCVGVDLLRELALSTVEAGRRAPGGRHHREQQQEDGRTKSHPERFR